MVPVSYFRVMALFVAIAFGLVLADDAIVWAIRDLNLIALTQGLAMGLAVFTLTFFGRRTLMFVMRDSQVDPAVHDRASVILNKIVLNVPKRVRLVVFSSEKPIAVTVNDGRGCCIFISSAMVSGLSDSALTGVLSHECGHIIENHPLRQACLLGTLALAKSTLGITLPVMIAVLLAYLYMSRYWEFVADMRATGLSGRESVVDALNGYREISGDKELSRFSELLCGHPNLSRRVLRLNAMG